MNNRLAVILSSICLAALCVAATTNQQSGGLPALTERLTALDLGAQAQAARLATLESVTQAQAGRLAALETLAQAQAQEIETLRQQLAAIQPCPFTQAEADRLKDLSDVVWVQKREGQQWGNQVFVDGSLLVRRTCFMTFLYARGGNITGSWTLPNAAGWTFRDWE